MTSFLAKSEKTVIHFLYYLIVGLAFQGNANANSQFSCNTITEEAGFTIRSIQIKGKWVPQNLQKRVEKTVEVGKQFSPTDITLAIEEVRNILVQQEENNVASGASSVLYIDGGACDVSEDTNLKEVEIVIHPYYLNIDLANLGSNNILPIFQINTPTFSGGVPPSILGISPIIGFSSDRNYGESINFKSSTNLLNLPFVDPEETNNESTALNLDLDTRLSFNQPFYELNSALEYASPSYSGQLGENYSIGYSNQFEPLGEGENWQEQFQIKGSIQKQIDRSLIRDYVIGSEVKFLSNSFTPNGGDSIQNNEIGLKLYTIGDTKIKGGSARLGVWFDTGFPSETSSYQRLAVQTGYATEIGSGHNTLGLQLMAGSGYAWGNPPEYSRFFGGASASNYLYEQLNSSHLGGFPSGPLIRSFGEQEAGLEDSNDFVTGGDFYWHANLNLTFPIRQWSKPLIPDVSIDDRGGTLRSALKGQANSAETTIFFDLVDNEGYPDNEETEAIAERIVNRDIKPTLNYLADRANIYSIKPMLLFDIAQISGDNGLGSQTWTAAGGGIQVNIVNGRFEAGYMQTLTPASDSSIGNFFLRVGIQDLF